MKATIALSCLLFSAATIQGAQAAQIKTPTVAPRVTISQPKITQAGAGAAAGKVSLKEFQLTKKTDGSSPLLFRSASTGGGAGKSSFHPQDDKGGKTSESPSESVSLNFSKVEWHYNTQQ